MDEHYKTVGIVDISTAKTFIRHVHTQHISWYVASFSESHYIFDHFFPKCTDQNLQLHITIAMLATKEYNSTTTLLHTKVMSIIRICALGIRNAVLTELLKCSNRTHTYTRNTLIERASILKIL